MRAGNFPIEVHPDEGVTSLTESTKSAARGNTA